ncbi:unnamed protein product [Rotaria sordida]|uniref:Uncharacterized protein n=2 Tax=Rotaria sordida TaxID=392033 RepID=A0A820D131_9BILA|nr:unnamed protein product [Rotaria sordida]
MKLYGILFIVIFLIDLCTARDKFLDRRSLQDYIDSFIDIGKLKNEGVLSLNGTTLRKIWSFFKAKYHRWYSSTGEEGARLHIFRDHLKYVLESNFEKLRTYRLALNEFSDWTLAEFNAFKNGLNVPANLRRDFIDDESDEDEAQRSLSKFYRRHYHARRLKRSLKTRQYKDRRFLLDWFDKFFDKDKNKNDTSKQTNIVDWRAKNVVGPIRTQGKCGSCYAFATVAVMETLYAIKTNSQNVTELSPQQIVDCSSDGNNGCSGGNFPPSVSYLSAKGGKIATEASYPYGGKKDSCRKNDANEIELGKVEYAEVPVGDENKLAEALTNTGPIFIGIDASHLRFMFYKSGILNIKSCKNRPQDMNHAVVIVGHGYDEGRKIPYWIIKNSWGTKWGESGYLRLIKDAGNMCGVASMAFSAKLT